jgi:hypothetical protein
VEGGIKGQDEDLVGRDRCNRLVGKIQINLKEKVPEMGLVLKCSVGPMVSIGRWKDSI